MRCPYISPKILTFTERLIHQNSFIIYKFQKFLHVQKITISNWKLELKRERENENINKKYLSNWKFSKLDPKGTSGPIGLENISYITNHASNLEWVPSALENLRLNKYLNQNIWVLQKASFTFLNQNQRNILMPAVHCLLQRLLDSIYDRGPFDVN